MDKSEQLEVSQADRDAAAWALDRAPNSQTWETLTAAHRTPDQIWQANRVAQAFARHRQATEARMAAAVEALEAVLPFTRAEELAEAAQVRLRKSDRNPVHKAVTKARQALAEIRSVTNG